MSKPELVKPQKIEGRDYPGGKHGGYYGCMETEDVVFQKQRKVRGRSGGHARTVGAQEVEGEPGAIEEEN